MRGRSWVVVSLLVVLSVGAAAGIWVRDSAVAEAAAPGVVAANGRLKTREIRVAAETGGRVLEVRFREGQRVREGDTLALLDGRSQEAAVAAAGAAVAAAEEGVIVAERRARALESQVGLAALEARRYRRLFERDAVSRQAAERAEAALDQLENEAAAARAARTLAAEQVRLARAELRAVEVALAETAIVAPLSGVVSEILVRQGEVAGPGQPVVTVRRTGDVQLEVYLSLDEAGHVFPGAPVRVRVDAFPGRVFNGTVEHVASEAEFTPRDIHMPDERTSLVYAVAVRVQDPDGLLKDGFPADAQIRWDESAAWPETGSW